MFEFQVKLLVGKLLQVVRDEKNIPTDVVAAAFADCVGVLAATTDKEVGVTSLVDRMQLFDVRVAQTYRRVRDTMETAALAGVR